MPDWVAWNVIILPAVLAFFVGRLVGSKVHGTARRLLVYALVAGGIVAVLAAGQVISLVVLIIAGFAWVVSLFGVLTAPERA